MLDLATYTFFCVQSRTCWILPFSRQCGKGFAAKLWLWMHHPHNIIAPAGGAICHTMIPIHQIRNRGQMHDETIQWFRVLRPFQSPARSYKICECWSSQQAVTGILMLATQFPASLVTFGVQHKFLDSQPTALGSWWLRQILRCGNGACGIWHLECIHLSWKKEKIT